MKIIEPSIQLLQPVDGDAILKSIEYTGRTCYKSEDKISSGSAVKFVSMLLKRGHESVIEHEKITVKIICDRGVSHELVRHRIASYSQESTRYCNYANDKFGGGLTFIRPCFWAEDSAPFLVWQKQMQAAEDGYLELLRLGAKPEEARSILPNSLKTEIVATMNLREWRHFFRLRLPAAAHPQMREIARMLLKEFQSRIPVIFDGLEEE